MSKHDATETRAIGERRLVCFMGAMPLKGSFSDERAHAGVVSDRRQLLALFGAPTYQRMSDAPQVSPPPKAIRNASMPRCRRPVRAASSSAIGIDADDVLP